MVSGESNARVDAAANDAHTRTRARAQAHPDTNTVTDIPHPLPQALAALIAERFRVLAEPMRILLLDVLRDGEATVGQLQSATGSSQQNVSKHLGVLLGAGLIRRRKEGNFAVYEIADPEVFALCEQVCGGLRRRLAELDDILQTTT